VDVMNLDCRCLGRLPGGKVIAIAEAQGRRLVSALAIGTVAIGASTGAWAHGDGEDHAAEPMQPQATGVRLAAQSHDFELVAVAQGKRLTIYLDRFVDNQPVSGAKLEIDPGDGKTVDAVAAGDGVYTMTADWVEQPGRHDLVFTVIADTASDLLAGTLEIPTAAALAAAAGTPPLVLSKRPAIDNAVAFLLGMVTAFGMVRFGGAGAAASAWSRLAALTLASRVRAKRAQLDAGIWLGSAAKHAATQFAAARATALALLTRRRETMAVKLRPALVTVAPALGGFATALARKRSVFAIALVIYLIAMAILLAGRSVFAHEGHDDGDQHAALAGAAGNNPHRLLDGTLFVPKATQRLLNVKTAITEISDAQRTVRVVGQVVPDPGTSGQIHASIRGRLEPVGGRWPRVGDKVEAAQVLASVVPVVNPIDRGIILQQLAQIDHDTGLVQERLQVLTAADSAAPAQERDDARAELANLIRRRNAIAAVLRDRDTLRAPLLAPSSGIIAASFAVAGQIVDEQQNLFDIVNLKHLWVEAYAYDVSGLGTVTDANAVGPSGSNYRLKFMSRGPQLQKQTIPLYFQIENADAKLSVGSLVTVLIGTNGEHPGVILPRSAVVRDTAGQEIVWQHAHPEGFTAIPVRIAPIDGEKVMVSAGLTANMRVVVEGADLLNEVR
jgi:membrane fusion protein, heavy metal efflux system